MTSIAILLAIGMYPYIVYPVVVRLLGFFRDRTPILSDDVLSVTVIIAAYNEEDVIEQTVANKLSLDYPADKLNIVVVSDGSEDGTEAIVSSMARSTERIKLICQDRSGKTSGLNRAMSDVESDIVVFSDANSMYRSDAISKLVSRFGDDSVGYVSGRMIYGSPEESVAGDGSSVYIRYENWLRAKETKIGSMVGVDGGIDAVRRCLYQDMRPEELPDFALPLRVVEQGYRVVFASDAIMGEDALREASDELQMRIRVSARAIWTLIDFRHLLNPARTGLFSFQLISHKWMRYLSFAPISGAILMSVIYFGDSLWINISAVTLLALATIALTGFLFPVLARKSVLIRLISYFGLLNIASAVACVKVIRGQRVTTWQPRVG